MEEYGEDFLDEAKDDPCCLLFRPQDIIPYVMKKFHATVSLIIAARMRSSFKI